jgi:hypothetical protein
MCREWREGRILSGLINDNDIHVQKSAFFLTIFSILNIKSCRLLTPREGELERKAVFSSDLGFHKAVINGF